MNKCIFLSFKGKKKPGILNMGILNVFMKEGWGECTGRGSCLLMVEICDQ